MLGDIPITQATGPPPNTPAPIAAVEPAQDSPRAGRRHEDHGSQDRPHDTARDTAAQNSRTASLNGRRVRFNLDPHAERPVIQVVDDETGEVVRQIPPDELRQLEETLRRVRGLLLDRYA